MEKKPQYIQVGVGKHRVKLSAVTVPDGLVLTIFGGEKPHVGSVALAVPRPSLRRGGKRSATASVLTLVGHKDDALAKPTAELVARKTGMVVVAVVGVHIDNASSHDIALLKSNSNEAVRRLTVKLRRGLPQPI